MRPMSIYWNEEWKDLPTLMVVLEGHYEAAEGVLRQRGIALSPLNERFYYLTPQVQVVGRGGIAGHLEAFRRAVHELLHKGADLGFKQVQVVVVGAQEAHAQALGETIRLSTYRYAAFNPEMRFPIEEFHIWGEGLVREAFMRGEKIGGAVCRVRDWVNDPPNLLTPVELGRRFERLGQEHGFSVRVLDKEAIEKEKMGGLLAVNRGSQNPPVFIHAEYKPATAKNTRPFVVVGKGLTFDTGGLSLKKTQDQMDYMKCDMAGAGVVAGVMELVARMQMPYWVIGLVPATDNRPGENAYTPNDIIQVSDGSYIEILNTDAEGRVILSDALIYARRFDPGLVVDFATLTGAAAIALGPHASAMMGTASPAIREAFKKAGETTYERVVEFPLYEEYGEMIRSDVAAIKNSAGREAGAITAAKFLEYFTRYPWVHFDIAGTAYLKKPDFYRPKYGTGVGVRLIIEFLSSYGDLLS
ncbi:MAG: leucyl aminopeptidase family protein [Bacteroidia bacterium]